MKLRETSSFLAGLIFGLGLAIAQMTNPAKVLGFLDIAGAWDASLLLVLGGAVGVAVVAFHRILLRPHPLFADRFDLPAKKNIDARLVIGAAIFGVGWGVGGYCPGPAIASLASPSWETWVFLPAMFLGSALQKITFARKSTIRRAQASTPG